MKLRITKHDKPHDDYHVFECDYDGNLAWTPGAYGVFSMPDKEIEGKNNRYFSIASIHEEGSVKFATRIPEGCSNFKEILSKLDEGDEIHMEGPNGLFTFQDETTPVVMIAGGVGITPVRALFKELEKGNNRTVKLIYSTGGQHLFEDELREIADADEKINIDFVGGREELAAKVNQYADEFKNDAYYFITGPPAMTTAMSMLLDDKFIYEGRVVVEAFSGYA